MIRGREARDQQQIDVLDQTFDGMRGGAHTDFNVKGMQEQWLAYRAQ